MHVSSDPTDIDVLLCDIDDGIAQITLNRPERLNAFTSGMYGGLVELLDGLDRRDDVRVVVVTGAGRGFCSGADLGRGAGTFGSAQQQEGIDVFRDPGGRVGLRLYKLRKPVVGVVNGPAVGFGASLTLPMDLRVMSESAFLQFPQAGRGIVPEGTAGWFLPRMVGIARALDWTLTGRRVDADEMLAAGLAHSVLPTSDVLAAGLELANRVARTTAPVSAAATRQLLWRSLGESSPEATHRLESSLIWRLGSTPDSREGVAAFLERRPPRWTMRPSEDLPPELG